MSQPTVGAAAQELYDRLAPIYGASDPEANSWMLLRLCEAFTAGMELFEVLLGDDDLLPWAVLFDVDQCPDDDLPWLAWVTGVVVRGETGDTLRALIRDRPPAKRGTDDALRAAVAATLTGTKVVRFIPRAGGPFADTLITRPSETPDPAATFAAAVAQKRAGCVLTHVLSDEPVIDEWTRSIDATTAATDDLALADVT